jgi:glucokinase
MTSHLLADIDGKQARFALLSESRLGPIHSIEVAEYASATHAIKHFLNREADNAVVDKIVVAAAGPVSGGRCVLANAPWTLEADELRTTVGVSSVSIINDLEALAWTVPHLEASDVEAVGKGHEVAGEPIVVIAPGTGLGIACLLPGGNGARVLVGEGGHATLAATCPQEASLIELLHKRHQHVSAERLLSGPGLVTLYGLLAEREQVRVKSPSAARIVKAAIDGSCERSRETLNVFCALLGSVAGSSALMFGAQGGVYIADGIVAGMVEYLQRTGFRAQFENKGRLRRYLPRIPTKIIVRPDPVVIGLIALAGGGPAANASTSSRQRPSGSGLI